MKADLFHRRTETEYLSLRLEQKPHRILAWGMFLEINGTVDLSLMSEKEVITPH